MQRVLLLLLSARRVAGASAPRPTPPHRPIVWTIAGSASGGGAGIQADLHAFHSLGAHGCSVVTATTAQNSHEVRMVEHASPPMLRATIDALADDLPARAIKIGMLGRESTVDEVSRYLGRAEGAPRVQLRQLAEHAARCIVST